MLAESDDWKPRWYYIMRNATSGMKYVGQSVNLITRSYCGSGQYWVAHCKKHGGHTRKNIEIIEKFFAENKLQAIQWLESFELKNPNYFKRSNKDWANRTKETTEDSAFFGLSKEDRLKFARSGGLVASKIPGHMSKMASIQGKNNIETGHIKEIQKIGCHLGGKIAGPISGRIAVESGQLYKAAKLGGKKVCDIRHSKKDEVTGKSVFAVNLGQASGRTRKLLAKFCIENSIKKPGVNYVNVDRQAFNEWRIKNAC